MESWLKISLLLCVFGFIKELRPSEPFIYEYLIGPWRNITGEQINQEVYPIGTYGYLAQLFIIFLITDLLRYKPLIILLGLSGIVVWSMLSWTTSLLCLQILEIFYGTFMATEVAYFTYIYAKVPKEYYQQVTSHTRAAILAGRAISSVIAQILVSFDLMDYKQLNYITLGAMVLATIWAIFLPSVKKTIYFHQSKDNRVLVHNKYKSAFNLMSRHFKQFSSNKYVMKWSFWWALATCGFIQVTTYVQPLWEEVNAEEARSYYNGAVEALLTLLGFIGALIAGVSKVDWENKGELILSLCSICEGALLIMSSQTESLILCYACYIGFGAIYHFMITSASAEVAKYIVEDSYGLIFGFNTMMALLLQTILTLCLVTGDVVYALTPRNQFLAYGVYHFFIASLFILIGLITWIKSDKDMTKTYN